MNFKKSLFLSIVYLSVVFVSQAQLGFIKKGGNQKEGTTNYPLDLSQAEDDFERGNLAGIEAKLKSGIDNKGFSKEEEIRVHRLLTLVHLFSDNEPAAEEEIMKLLKADPEHPINELTDPEEFKFLYRKFRTKPIFRIAFTVGLNQTRVNAMDLFATTDLTNASNAIASGEIFSPRVGIQYGVAIEREFGFKGLEASLGVMMTAKNHSIEDNIIDGISTTDGGIPEPFSKLSFTDAASYLDIPLSIRYNIELQKKIIPYVFIGVEANLLLTASRKDGGRTGAQSISAGVQDLKTTEERNSTNYSLIGGIGFKYRVKTHFIKFELKYSNGMTNVINPENRYVDQTTVFRLAHVDNNQSLNVVSASIGYVRSIYNPKKLKKYRK
jgi:hypothetical protein